MDHPPPVEIQDLVSETKYFKENIECLLRHLYPTFHCLKLVVKLLLHGPDGSGKRMLAKLAATNLNIKFCDEHVVDMLDGNIFATEDKIKATFAKYSASDPCLIYLSGYELFCHLEEPDLDRVVHAIKDSLKELLDASSQPVILVASTNAFDSVYKTHLSDIFQHDIFLKPPTLDQAKEMIETLTSKLNLQSENISVLDKISSPNDHYLGNLLHLIGQSEVDIFSASLGGKPGDLEPIAVDKGQNSSDGTRWLDIGGLGHVKDEIIDAIQLSLDYPQLKNSGLRRTGILLFGPPGTGKTLLAKAVATECKLNFINVKGPELLNEYVGQSEDNVRRLFQRARDCSPSVIFFDEIDSLVPNRGQTGDSGGVMDRMVSQMLAEMDGVGKSEEIFVIGATNRVDLVDPSLLRPGRFDKVLEVPLPTSRESRLEILNALTRKMKLAKDVDLEQIERLAPPGMSGAEFQGLCSRSLQRSFNRCVELVESGRCTEDEVEIRTSLDDFIASLT